MFDVTRILAQWPIVAALTVTTALVSVSAEEQLGLKIFPRRTDLPEKPTPLDPPPDTPKGPSVPLAPAPGWDDRTPLEYLSQSFALNDPDLPSKLSGVGPTFWKHSGQGTGALIAPDVVLTTGHLFAKDGKWYGSDGGTNVPPPASGGAIYLAACKQSYAFTHVELGSLSPRKNLGLDYAIATLAHPACPEATVLQTQELTDGYIQHHDAMKDVLMSLGAYRFADLPRYANHPFFTRDANQHPYHVFGVRCRMSGLRDTGDDTGLLLTDGCDGVPGGSGGPIVLSRDDGKTYRIVGVTNSYSTADSEYNNYTRITGQFAAHLVRFLPDIPTILAQGD